MNPHPAPYIDDPIPGVLGGQHSTFFLDHVALQRRLTINSGSDDVLVDRGLLLAHNGEVAIQDACTHHAVPDDSHGEAGFPAGPFRRERDPFTVVVLFSKLRHARRDVPDEGSAGPSCLKRRPILAELGRNRIAAGRSNCPD